VDDGKRPTMFFTTSTGRIEIPPSVYVLKDEEVISGIIYVENL
jgi:hypothetical protein